MTLVRKIKRWFFGKPNGRQEQVRFSRDRSGHRKDTLYTEKMDGFLFYGISRLNKSDEFNRQHGVNLAKDRAFYTLSFYNEYQKNKKLSNCIYNYGSNCGMYSSRTSEDVLGKSYFGWVKQEDAVELIKYFRNLGK